MTTHTWYLSLFYTATLELTTLNSSTLIIPAVALGCTVPKSELSIESFWQFWKEKRIELEVGACKCCLPEVLWKCEQPCCSGWGSPTSSVPPIPGRWMHPDDRHIQGLGHHCNDHHVQGHCHDDHHHLLISPHAGASHWRTRAGTWRAWGRRRQRSRQSCGCWCWFLQFGTKCTFMGLSLITSMEMCSDPANA